MKKTGKTDSTKTESKELHAEIKRLKAEIAPIDLRVRCSSCHKVKLGDLWLPNGEYYCYGCAEKLRGEGWKSRSRALCEGEAGRNPSSPPIPAVARILFEQLPPIAKRLVKRIELYPAKTPAIFVEKSIDDEFAVACWHKYKELIDIVYSENLRHEKFKEMMAHEFGHVVLDVFRRKYHEIRDSFAEKEERLMNEADRPGSSKTYVKELMRQIEDCRQEMNRRLAGMRWQHFEDFRAATLMEGGLTPHARSYSRKPSIDFVSENFAEFFMVFFVGEEVPWTRGLRRGAEKYRPKSYAAFKEIWEMIDGKQPRQIEEGSPLALSDAW